MLQLASENAECLVAPPADTPSSLELRIMLRLDAMEELTKKQAKRTDNLEVQTKEQGEHIAKQAEQISEQGELIAKQAEQINEQGEHIAKHAEQISEQGEHIAKQAEQINEQGEHIAKQAEQISEHNKIMFYPLCIRQLCVLAQEVINVKDGNKRGSGVIPLKPDAPNWALSWLIGSGNGSLYKDDLRIIFATTPGSTRGDANKAIKEKDQAAAVRAVADAQEQASLARIFCLCARPSGH